MKRLSKIMKGIGMGIIAGGLLLSSVACNDGGSGGAGKTLTIYIIEGNYYTGTKKDSVWKKIEEKVGCEIEITGALNDDTYYTSLSPVLNNYSQFYSDVPHIFFSVPSGSNGYYNWSNRETGILLDWEAEMAGKEGEYSYLNRVFNSEQYKNITFEDARTLLPNIGARNNSWGIYYRGDWLVKIGYYQKNTNGEPVDKNGDIIDLSDPSVCSDGIIVNTDRFVPVTPVTLEEFEDVLCKFSKNEEYHFNEQITNTYGMSPISGEWGFNPLYHAFGASTDYDIDENGNVEYMCLQAEYKAFIEWMRECYKNKWIDPSFNTNGTTGDRTAFEEGRCGIVISSAGNHMQWIAVPMESRWGKGKTVMGAPPVGTGTTSALTGKKLGKAGAHGFSDWGGYWGGFSMTYKCATEGVTDYALKLFDYLYSPEGQMLVNYGIENVHWQYDKNGKVIITEENLANREKEPNGTFRTSEDEEGNKDLKGKYRLGGLLRGDPIDWEEFDKSGKIEINTSWEMVSIAYADLMEQAAVYFDDVSTSRLVNVTSLPTKILSYISLISSKCDEYIIGAICGHKDLDEDYNTLVAECNNSIQNYGRVQQAYASAARSLGIIE